MENTEDTEMSNQHSSPGTRLFLSVRSVVRAYHLPDLDASISNCCLEPNGIMLYIYSEREPSPELRHY